MNEIPRTLKGKRAVVTGAGSGIGKASAILLAQAGAEVILIGHTADELEAAAVEIGGEAGGHFAITADVGDEMEMTTAFRTIAGRWPRLDILVANAGINGTWAPLEDLCVNEWNSTLNTNLTGTFLTTKLALPLMREAGGGSMVIVSSVNGTRIFSNSGATAYSCSKAAQVAFAKMTALELAKDRIRVNVICPGAIETRIEDSTEHRDTAGLHLPVEFPKGVVPLTGGDSGTAMQVARLVWFLATDLSNHITGAEIHIDGAQSLLQG